MPIPTLLILDSFPQFFLKVTVSFQPTVVKIMADSRNSKFYHLNNQKFLNCIFKNGIVHLLFEICFGNLKRY